MRTTTRRLSKAGIALTTAIALTACGGGSAGAFCDDMEALEEEFGGLDPSSAMTDPESASQTLGDMATALEGVDAPEEIAGDLDTLTSALTAIADASEGMADDPQAAAEAMQNIDIQGLTTAGQNLDAYTNDNC